MADILFGKVSPSGKLPVTFYYNDDLEHMPEFTDYSMKGRTYRYLERKPLYPFGYGLTYGDVQVENVETAGEAGDVQLDICVKNHGACETEDVVQVYVKDMDSVYEVKNSRLCGYQRVKLQPGEEKNISIFLPKEVFYVVNEQGERLLDGKHFRLSVGTSQPDERSRELTGKDPVSIEIQREALKD